MGLGQWKTLYRAGKLDAQVKPARCVPGPEPSATFVPVSLLPAVRRTQPAAGPDAIACRSGIVQLVLTSGVTLRIETGALDAALVCDRCETLTVLERWAFLADLGERTFGIGDVLVRQECRGVNGHCTLVCYM